MDHKLIDLEGRKGADILLTLSGVVRPYYAVVKKPGADQVYYQRKAIDSTLLIKVPYHSPKVSVSIIGEPKIESFLVKALFKTNLPYPEATVQRNFSPEQITFSYNHDQPSAARFHTDKPLVEFNPSKYDQYDVPTRTYIGMHELGHQWHDDEDKADRFATIFFLNSGFPQSAAIYALTNVLNRGAHANIMRMIKNNEFVKNTDQQYAA